MSNELRSYIKSMTEKRTGLKLDFLKDSKYRKGQKYFNGYWGQTYTVLIVDEEREFVTVQWADGERTSHYTSLDTDRDYVVLN